MSKKKPAISLLMLFIIISFTAIMSARGIGQGEWIKSYTVADSTTGQVLMEVNFETGRDVQYSSILAGSDITVTFTVNVFATGSGNLVLSTAMAHSSVELDRYWDLISSGYSLGSGFNPNSATTEINWVQGTFTMKCYGKVSQVDRPTPVVLVQLSSPAGEVLDAIRPTVVTAAVDEFYNLYYQKENKRQSLVDAGVPSGYIQLFSNVLAQSTNLADKGYVSEALELLNSLPDSGEPMGSALGLIMFPAIIIGAAAAVVFAFMFIKARGKNSYLQLVIEDQIKDLEGLSMRASKIDRRLSMSLEDVKERLRNLVGV